MFFIGISRPEIGNRRQKSTPAYPKLFHLGLHTFSVTKDGHIGANQNPRFQHFAYSKEWMNSMGSFDFGLGSRMPGQRIPAPLNNRGIPQAHSSLMLQILNNSSWGRGGSEERKNKFR